MREYRQADETKGPPVSLAQVIDAMDHLGYDANHCASLHIENGVIDVEVVRVKGGDLYIDRFTHEITEDQ